MNITTQFNFKIKMIINISKSSKSNQVYYILLLVSLFHNICHMGKSRGELNKKQARGKVEK